MKLGSIEQARQRTKLGLSASYLKACEPELVEIGARRNLVVHNGGRVNHIYLSKVGDPPEGSELGKSIAVDRACLDRSIDTMHRMFVLIGLEYWRKIDPDDAECRSGFGIDRSFEALCDERWDLAGSIAEFLRRDAHVNEEARLIGQVNYWIAMKWSGQFEIVQSDVQNADFSGKHEKCVLARIVLLDQFDDSWRLLGKLIDHETFSEKEVREWPLFRGLRNQPDFEERLAGALKAPVSRGTIEPRGSTGGENSQPDAEVENANKVREVASGSRAEAAQLDVVADEAAPRS